MLHEQAIVLARLPELTEATVAPMVEKEAEVGVVAVVVVEEGVVAVEEATVDFGSERNMMHTSAELVRPGSPRKKGLASSTKARSPM